MKFKHLIYIFILFNISFLPLQTQNFVAVLIGDTLDDFIGETVRIDLKRMEEQVKEIANGLDLPLKKIVIRDKNFESKTLLNIISKIKVKSDDIVFIYYSGHGYRVDSSESQWPNIALGREWKGLGQKELTKVFLNKKPYFLISIADACNNVIPEIYAPELVLPKSFYNDELAKENLKKLFLEKPLFIMASGSSPDYYSYCNLKKGGFFSYHFLMNLNHALQSYDESDWALILSKTKEKLEEKQKPQYEILPLSY